MGELGHGRCADPDNEDRSGLLACFHPDDASTARIVLHPRLTFVPCREAYHDALAATFAAGIAARVVTAADVASWDPDAPDAAHPDDFVAQISQVHTAVVRLAGDEERAALREERSRLERERAALAPHAEVPPIVHEVRAALRDHELELWAAQRRIESTDAPGPERLAALLASAGVPDDGPLDDRARRWLAAAQLDAHYAQQHLAAIDDRIAELAAMGIEAATSVPLPDAARTDARPARSTKDVVAAIASASSEPLLVLVEVVTPDETELIDALLDASEHRRIVYVSGVIPFLRMADLLPMDLAAVLDPIVTPRTAPPAPPAPVAVASAEPDAPAAAEVPVTVAT